jgi:hypothetical protein
MKWFLQIFFLIVSPTFECQSIEELELVLIKKLELVHYEKNFKNSLTHNNNFKILLESVLSNPDAFEYEFDSLSNFMSTVKSPDGFFRLFNWNIQLKSQKQHYECWVLLEDKTIIKLFDFKNKIPNVEYETFKSNNWLGALYFEIIPLIKKNKTIYTLLGWDGNDMFSNKKIIESMTFSKKKDIQFGVPIFNYPDGKNKRRVIFQYNKDSYMSLKHNLIKREKYIIFDHLSPTSPNLKDFPDWYVTDLSFDAFKWEGNQWNYIKDFDAKSLRALRRPFNDPQK